MKHNIKPNHVGISVNNLDEAIAWYREILGFEVVERVMVDHIRCEIAVIRMGDFDIELFGHLDSKPQPADRLHPDDDMKTQGTKHLCFSVEGLDAFMEEITAKGVKIIIGPGEFAGNRFYYICDNSGVLIELNEKIK